MNRSQYHDLDRKGSPLIRLAAKHPGTYLTTRFVVYTDPCEFVLHDADVFAAIERRHANDLRTVSHRLAPFVNNNNSGESPYEVHTFLMSRSLIDWVDYVANPEEFSQVVSDIRLLDELVHDRVNYEVQIHSATGMD